MELLAFICGDAQVKLFVAGAKAFFESRALGLFAMKSQGFQRRYPPGGFLKYVLIRWSNNALVTYSKPGGENRKWAYNEMGILLSWITNNLIGFQDSLKTPLPFACSLMYASSDSVCLSS